MSEEIIIPHGYFNIDDMWFDVRYSIINEVISSAISHISLHIPDFKPKWRDIPEKKIDEWHDFVFRYDVRLWQPRPDNETVHIIEYRLYELRETICKFFMEKFNIKVVNGRYVNEQN